MSVVVVIWMGAYTQHFLTHCKAGLSVSGFMCKKAGRQLIGGTISKCQGKKENKKDFCQTCNPTRHVFLTEAIAKTGD